MNPILKLGNSRMNKKTSAPIRMWIDGFSYNIPRGEQKVVDEHHKLFDIKADESGSMYTQFSMPITYYHKLQSPRFFILENFNEATKTKLEMSKCDKTVSFKISGESYETVANARDEMHTVLEKIRSQLKPLQFISIPTLHEDIKNSFNTFKQEILSLPELPRGVDESIFIAPEKLHLTIAVMTLLDETEIDEATQVLNECYETISKTFMKDGKPLTIEVKGIDRMDKGLSKINVLYAKAKLENETEECTLQKIANSIADSFHKRGFNREPKDNVKLHVTLINTKYRKKHGYKNKRIPFDARYIMEKYKDYYFGKTIVDSLQLSLMGSVGPDGFYKPLSVIKFI